MLYKIYRIAVESIELSEIAKKILIETNAYTKREFNEEIALSDGIQALEITVTFLEQQDNTCLSDINSLRELLKEIKAKRSKSQNLSIRLI